MTRQASETLLSTLEQTEQEVSELKAMLLSQLDAVRTRDTDQLNDSTEEVTHIARRLGTLLAKRGRQSKALADMLTGEAPLLPNTLPADGLGDAGALEEQIRNVESRIRTHAEETHRLYEDLAFALHFAAKLDSDLIRAVWGARQPDEAMVYTPDGCTSQTGRSTGMVNQIG
jgi:hypothetical protein